ncbi:MAG TPA: serine hydrolase domain-containing protein [Pyrinomonadaceae bacterium]|nr:serine hydrolase domain-containing protein [Pyrinomonadaceae bacterium]
MPLRNFLRLFVALLLAAQTSFASTPSAARADREVDAYVARQMAKYQIPGLALAVLRDGKVLKLKGYGLSSVEFGMRADEHSVFQIYSTTKIFTGVALLKLVEDGRLTLDTPVTDVIENLPEEWKAVRVRNLLSHTSGLAELRESPRFRSLPDERKKYLPREEGVRFVAEVPLKFKPGEKFMYHTSGYNLLGVIVERLSKKSFAAFLEERVFAPLGMKATRMGDTESIVKGRPATAYIRKDGELRNHVYTFGVGGGNPGSGLNSSVADMAKFMAALDGGKVLKRESLEEMWSPMRLNDGTELRLGSGRSSYALGWTVDEHKGRRVVGHEGGGSAWVAHFPAERLSVVVLCNLNGARADEIQYGVADFYLGQ